jgi:hypothetical protein
VIGRRQLAVASPIDPARVLGAFAASMGSSARHLTQASDLIDRTFKPRRTCWTDSGTSALVLALRMLVPTGGRVGLPAFACVDLVAAARRAGVRVRLYDVDPDTLGPSLSSVESMVRRGVDAVVIAHLYGYPADVPGVRRVLENTGIPIIEDAAQGAGASLGGRLVGSLGDVTVLSFGRGKGLCAGGGGALLGFSARFDAAFDSLALPYSGRGWSGLAKTIVQWGLGRPAAYAIPSMLPWLHLGEMVYHPAAEPRAISSGSVALLPSAMEQQPRALAARRQRATELDAIASGAPRFGRVVPIATAEPGYLRYAVRDLGASRSPAPRLGVLRSYPHTLGEEPELAPVLEQGESAAPGASDLRRTLLTLPSHHFVTRQDMSALADWIRHDSK